MTKGSAERVGGAGAGKSAEREPLFASRVNRGAGAGAAVTARAGSCAEETGSGLGTPDETVLRGKCARNIARAAKAAAAPNHLQVSFRFGGTAIGGSATARSRCTSDGGICALAVVCRPEATA